MTREITETAAWTSPEGIAAAVRVVDDVIRAARVPVFAQRRSLQVAWDDVCTLSSQVKVNCWAMAEVGCSRRAAWMPEYCDEHQSDGCPLGVGSAPST